MKIGSMDSISAATRGAINECFQYQVLAFFSFRGKTKRSFSNLKLSSVIYGELLINNTNFNLFNDTKLFESICCRICI